MPVAMRIAAHDVQESCTQLTRRAEDGDAEVAGRVRKVAGRLELRATTGRVTGDDKNGVLFCAFLRVRARKTNVSPGRKKVNFSKPTEKWVVFIMRHSRDCASIGAHEMGVRSGISPTSTRYGQRR